MSRKGDRSNLCAAPGGPFRQIGPVPFSAGGAVMSREAIKLPAADSELARLVESMCDGTITPAEGDRLESLLADDRDAKLYYVAYLDLHAQVQWMMRDEGLGLRTQGSDAAEQQSALSNQQSFNSSHHSRFVRPAPLLALHSPLSRRRLSVLLHGVGGDSGSGVVDRPDVDEFSRATGKMPPDSMRNRQRSLSAGSPARSIAGGPSGQWSVVSGQWSVSPKSPIPNPKSQIRNSSSRLAQVQPDFGLHGDHLRHAGPKSSCRALARMKSSRPPAASFRSAN